jgi:hypothetical protein
MKKTPMRAAKKSDNSANTEAAARKKRPAKRNSAAAGVDLASNPASFTEPNSRLRTQRKQFAAGEAERGRSVGLEYVRRSAHVDELERVATHDEQYGTESFFEDDPLSPASVASLATWRISTVMFGEDNESFATKFWEHWYGDGIPNVYFLEAFVTALVEAHHAIDD